MQKELQTRDVTADITDNKYQTRTKVRDFDVQQWRRWLRWSLVFSGGLFLADRFLKWIVVSFSSAADLGLVEFTKFMNHGIVFSLPVPQWFYLPIAVAIFAVFLFLFVSAIKCRLSTAFGLSFVLLGALSNLIDRMAYGATVDYLVFFDLSAVNLADGMILLGVVLYIRSRNIHQKTG